MQRLACLFILVAVLGCKKDETAAPSEPAAAPTADPSAAPTAPAEPAPAATPPPAAESKACTLITQEELVAAVPDLKDGGEGKPSRSGGADVCTWMTTKGVILQAFAYASDYDNSRKAFEDLYEAKGEDMPGVGDKAYTVVGKTGHLATTTLVTAKGGKAISVQVMGVDDAAKSKEAAKALANAALSRL